MKDVNKFRTNVNNYTCACGELLHTLHGLCAVYCRPTTVNFWNCASLFNLPAFLTLFLHVKFVNFVNWFMLILTDPTVASQ